MTKPEFFDYCNDTFDVSPDYPFEGDTETVVLRHSDSGKWFAILMRVSRKKLGIDSDETVDIVNLKQPLEMFGSFGVSDGVFPAYHMNKLHWISVILCDAKNDVIDLLTDASYEATKVRCHARKKTVKKGILPTDERGE